MNELVTYDPNVATKILFGKNYTYKDILTFEQTWKAFNSKNFPYPYAKEAIITRFEQELKAQGFLLPTELRQSKVKEKTIKNDNVII